MNDDDDDDLKRLILGGKREWNGFWFWRDKPWSAKGALPSEVLEAAKVEVADLRSLDQDPPGLRSTSVTANFSGIAGDGTGSSAHA